MIDNFRIEFCLLLINSLIAEFTQRFDKDFNAIISFGFSIHNKPN